MCSSFWAGLSSEMERIWGCLGVAECQLVRSQVRGPSSRAPFPHTQTPAVTCQLHRRRCHCCTVASASHFNFQSLAGVAFATTGKFLRDGWLMVTPASR